MTRTVLVVDDDSEFLEMIDLVLAGESLRVVSCLVDLEAPRTARRLKPDVILIDLRVGSVYAWQVIESLRSEATTANIPVIVCTACVIDAAARVRLRRWKCDILLKPFELVDLLSLLEAAGDRGEFSESC